MVQDDSEGRPEVGRWVIVALVILVGIVMFFLFGPDTSPAIVPNSGGGA